MRMAKIAMACLMVTISFSMQAQNDRKVIRQGIKSYDHGDFSEAEVQFRKAKDMNHESFEAEYNTGAALYKQEKFEESSKQYLNLAQKAEDPNSMGNVWHNIGNSLLESQKYGESIEAYKNSLRLNPKDQDTKYNLAYAMQKLQEQQQQEQNQDQNQDQQDQQKQDQQEQNRDQNQDQQDQQNQDQQDQQKQDQQDQPMQISREDAQRMLDAIQQQEKDVKEKVDEKKAAAAKVKTEKDW
ncbi:MAG: tetratricopeptide repeat protein [Bacteroidales bacterium]